MSSGPADPAAVTLHQFRFSHFNEKARWALDWKGVAHRRVSVLPGPHRAAMRRISGQSSTPVLVMDGTAIAGSARILAALEQRYPEPPLYPADPALRIRALEVEAHFDRVVGPAVRTALYADLLAERWFLSGLFSLGQPPVARSVYRICFPLVARLIRKGYRVDDPAAVARSLEESRRALDFVVANAGPGGYLVGNAFSVADLSCAALLAPLACPDHPDMAWPQPHPPRVREFLARWSQHPGTAWVRECYARHRS